MQFLCKNSNRAATLALVLLLSFYPYAVDIANAETTRDGTAAPFTSSIDHPTGKLATGVHDGKHAANLILSAGNQYADAWFNTDGVSFGDGFAFAIETVADNNQHAVKKLTATAPDGRHAVATIRLDRGTQVYSSEGIDRVKSLLEGSDQFPLFSALLPAVIANVQSHLHTKTAAGRVSPMYVLDGPFSLDFLLDIGIDASILGCIGSILLYLAAVIGVILGCLTPEPLEPLVCTGAILALLGAGAAMVDQCGDVLSPDGYGVWP